MNKLALLSVKNLTKGFEGHQVLKGIDFTINKGEVVVIVGPSGSGKTTFLNNLNFLETSDGGHMTFGPKQIDLAKPSKADTLWVRRHTAMVFQNYNLFKNKTALQNIAEGLEYGQDKPAKEAEQIALQALTQVGLADKKDAYPSQLSGGQQQRIGIARATALQPDIVLFDEPTSALDPELVGTVVDEMDQLAHTGQTMIVVTHLMSFARRVATKVIFFADGQILETGTPTEIFDHPQTQRAKTFFAAIAEDH